MTTANDMDVVPPCADRGLVADTAALPLHCDADDRSGVNRGTRSFRTKQVRHHPHALITRTTKPFAHHGGRRLRPLAPSKDMARKLQKVPPANPTPITIPK
jgi:hypothetical protein